MSATRESQAQTRVFAGVVGPWLAIVPGIIALRAPAMVRSCPISSKAIRSCGLRARCWCSGPADHRFSPILVERGGVMISLFGWILAMRGVALMAAPDLYEHAAYVYGRDISCAAHFRGPSIISYANITP